MRRKPCAGGLARVTGARHFEVMRGLGHFPMSESPEQFRHYLLPVLADVAGSVPAQAWR